MEGSYIVLYLTHTHIHTQSQKHTKHTHPSLPLISKIININTDHLNPLHLTWEPWLYVWFNALAKASLHVMFLILSWCLMVTKENTFSKLLSSCLCVLLLLVIRSNIFKLPNRKDQSWQVFFNLKDSASLILDYFLALIIWTKPWY